MAMSRSFGGTSLTTSPPIRTSPSVMSSRPAIMRRVVDLPQPDGPTRTTNSWSEISRSMPRTASTSSKRLTTLRSFTSAMSSSLGTSTLGGAGGEAGDVVVHQEGVDDERRRGAQQRAGHDLPPVEYVTLDERRYDADREHQLVGGRRESERVEELGPAHGEGENGRGDEPRQGHGNENLGQRLDPPSPIDQSGLVQLLGNGSEVADHDPSAEGHGERRVEEQQHPPAVDELNVGPLIEDRKHFEEGQEEQRLR